MTNIKGSRNTSLPIKLSIILLLLSIYSFAQVKVAGEMRTIMQRDDLSATIKLDSIVRSGLYGLGVVEGLKGEIIIIDGKCFVTSINEDELKTTSTCDAKAAMLVYENITSWSSSKSTRAIQDLKELEQYLEEVRAKGGKSLDAPFAFLLKSAKGPVNYHVIDWKNGVNHTTANHKQFAKMGELESNMTILGFYSNHHQGIFTHHDSNIHLHVISSDEKIVGHIDQLHLDNFELMLAD